MFDVCPLRTQPSHPPLLPRRTRFSRFNLPRSVSAAGRKDYGGKDVSRRRPKQPPSFGPSLFPKKPASELLGVDDATTDKEYDEGGGGIVWEEDELKAITSLFQSRIPQKPGKLVQRQRPLPLPLPHKLERPLGLPSPRKRQIRRRTPITVCGRGPGFLVGLAKEIKGLTAEENAAVVLDKHARFIGKGMLSVTIKELGRMGLPGRALQVFCWAKGQDRLFPDELMLASSVEVLARFRGLKLPAEMERFGYLASRGVIEAMARGFLDGGRTELALKVLKVAKDGSRMLDSGVYVKLISKLGKIPDNVTIVSSLLDDLSSREELSLTQQDCTTLMKVCVRLGRFEVVESLYNWYNNLGRDISVVMYTTLIHSRCMENKHREALPVIWEMEASNCLLDLPAYRVAIKLFRALNDLPRAVRYFTKLKEAGFSPTYDIYRAMIELYVDSGRLAKCKAVRREAEMAGFGLDRHSLNRISQLESGESSGMHSVSRV
ncbi:hypothetical protein MLD38_017893 [Melastoma candidum]|uniref:Uncharacterized protein n=1 Tax=Melastoma candidum TaxID=119954 RepID=A0ACB9QV85_9MYRT|nr:hypothetical protein MLD38_017893 [Melastoma candidum]